MKLGSENRKQVYILSALGVVAAYLVYTTLLAGPDVPKPSKTAARPTVAAPESPVMATPEGAKSSPGPRRALARSKSDEFHPVYLPKNPADRPDVRSIDPTLRMDLFGKVQGVELTGGSRNLFQFGVAPPKETVKLASNEPIVKPFVAYGPKPPAPPAPPPPPPPPPPITLKFYGFSTSQDNGKRTAYLLDGEEIYLAAEGDTVKRRYKIVRIAANSILVEDLDAKRQQSVPLTEEGTQ